MFCEQRWENKHFVRKEVVNHNRSFCVENFCCNMFWLMYKDPSSGWQGTRETLSCRTPYI